MESDTIVIVEFRDWLWGKFEEWRRGTTKGPAAFARYLGIKQQQVSAWLNGDYRPNLDGIAKLAERYPDIYEVLGVPDPLDTWPEPSRSMAKEIRSVMISLGPPADRPEVVSAINEIVARYGAAVTRKS